MNWHKSKVSTVVDKQVNVLESITSYIPNKTKECLQAFATKNELPLSRVIALVLCEGLNHIDLDDLLKQPEPLKLNKNQLKIINDKILKLLSLSKTGLSLDQLLLFKTELGLNNAEINEGLNYLLAHDLIELYNPQLKYLKLSQTIFNYRIKK